MTQKTLREQIEANQEAYERKLKYSNSEINDLQQKLDSMVNPITGEMSFEERTKESWKKEEAKDSKLREVPPVRKQEIVRQKEPEVKQEPADYFAEEKKEQQKPSQKQEHVSAASYFNEPAKKMEKQPQPVVVEKNQDGPQKK